jgi:hypothetical protein
MGCHILDPVYGSLGVAAPTKVRSEGEAPNADNWPLDCLVAFTFPGSKHTTEVVTVTWYNGRKRPPEEVVKLIGSNKLTDQGSVYIGTDGVLYSPYIDKPVVIGGSGKVENQPGVDHYLQFVEAVRGNDKASAPFDYSGPLTEMVLLGCLATRFPKTTLQWDAAALKVSPAEANKFVRREYRKGWEEEGLS